MQYSYDTPQMKNESLYFSQILIAISIVAYKGKNNKNQVTVQILMSPL